MLGAYLALIWLSYGSQVLGRRKAAAVSIPQGARTPRRQVHKDPPFAVIGLSNCRERVLDPLA